VVVVVVVVVVSFENFVGSMVEEGKEEAGRLHAG
jgi:hypothetical protein